MLTLGVTTNDRFNGHNRRIGGHTERTGQFPLNTSRYLRVPFKPTPFIASLGISSFQNAAPIVECHHGRLPNKLEISVGDL